MIALHIFQKFIRQKLHLSMDELKGKTVQCKFDSLLQATSKIIEATRHFGLTFVDAYETLTWCTQLYSLGILSTHASSIIYFPCCQVMISIIIPALQGCDECR